MNEIINIIPISPVNFEFQEYNSDDLSLIQTQEVEISFNPETDYIEYYVIHYCRYYNYLNLT